jgi:hypothetical protein
MPLVQTRGAASAQGFGEFAQVTAVNYIEDVFSSYLLVGTQTTTTINNGIDLSGKGGLVWLKDRTGAGYHSLGDTARSGKRLFSNTTDAEVSANPFAFTSTGVTLNGAYLDSGRNFVTWTFRKQPKFFDIVTYTGTGVARTVAHNLGSVPGCIIVKRTDTAGFDWLVYHRSTGNTNRLLLNDTVPAASGTSFWNDTTPTSTVFTVGTNVNGNASGGTYVAYVFAHDAGGFGLSGSDNVISCGDYTCVAYPGDVTVTLGYEPQWVMVKNATQVSNWVIYDNMRGMPATSPPNPVTLAPDSAAAENGVTGSAPGISPTATGFIARAGLTAVSGSAGDKVIYIAIRRGPMKVPTTGTSVFQPVTYSGNGSNNRLVDTTITPDLIIDMRRDNIMNKYVLDRLRGNGRLYSDLTNAESENTAQFPANTFNVNQTGVTVSADEVNASGRSLVIEAFRRAPSFFDVVCYTGNNVSGRTITHNLEAVPQLMIVKSRTSGTRDWIVYDATNGATKYMNLNNNSASGAGSFWVSTAPTSTVFTVSDSASVNDPAQNYVAYLFATCAGVSKVGSYSGNTSNIVTVNCGFTSGARFVLIKRTDSTGDWYVYDSARGISSSNDPYLFLNTDAAEVTGTNYVDTDTTGFKVTAAAPAALNATGGTYIFLAIA